MDKRKRNVNENTIFDQLQPLNLGDIHQIHSKSMEVLSQVGMRFESEEAIEIFKKHGFQVDGSLVFFTEAAIADALERVPSQFTLRARNPANNVTMGGENFAFAPGGGSPFIIDADGTIRRSRSSDYVNSLKLVQMLEDININRELITASGDVPQEQSMLFELKTAILYTDKPLDCSFPEGIELLAILFGVDPADMKDAFIHGLAYAIGTVNPSSPLLLDKYGCDCLLGLCRHGVAVAVSPLAMAGMTAPCTLPGLLIQQNAEILGTLVLAQLANPRCPVLYACMGTITDMMTTMGPMGAPETAIIASAAAQMARYYDMPSRGNVCLTDAGAIDYQAGAESAMNMISMVRCGINFLPGLGVLGNFNIGSLEKLVLDVDMAGYARRLIRPLIFSDETMAVSVIKEVGPKGNYINHDHTYMHFKSEFHQPWLFSRVLKKSKDETEAKDVMDRANQRVKWLLDEYVKPDIEPEIAKDLKRFVAEWPVDD